MVCFLWWAAWCLHLRPLFLQPTEPCPSLVDEWNLSPLGNPFKRDIPASLPIQQPSLNVPPWSPRFAEGAKNQWFLWCKCCSHSGTCPPSLFHWAVGDHQRPLHCSQIWFREFSFFFPFFTFSMFIIFSFVINHISLPPMFPYSTLTPFCILFLLSCSLVSLLFILRFSSLC